MRQLPAEVVDELTAADAEGETTASDRALLARLVERLRVYLDGSTVAGTVGI